MNIKMLTATLFASMMVVGPAEARPASPSCRESKLPYKLGIARYTMHRQTFDKALEMLQDMDVHYLGLMEGSIKYDASDDEIAAYKAKAAKYGVEVVSAGPLYYSTEAELRMLIANYIDQYNNIRPHEALDYATPASIYDASFAA